MNDSDFQKAVDAAATKHEADIVAYFGDIVRGEDTYLINECKRRRRRRNIILLLGTYGGDPNAAYRIARGFQDAYRTVSGSAGTPGSKGRRKEGDFIVCVDSICKSAGTIICLGADRLVMSENAELGPIDVQLRKQDEVGERTSGLTPIQAVQFLETQSVVLFKRHFKALRDANDLGFSTRMAADLAARMAIGLLEPIYQQIDPIRLAEVDRSLRISQDYGERLENGNLRDAAIEKLLAKYPSHGFVIDRREAREIFDKVEEPSPELVAVMDFLRRIARIAMSRDNEGFAYFVSAEPAAPGADDVTADVNRATSAEAA